jgi:hypothetical protein
MNSNLINNTEARLIRDTIRNSVQAKLIYNNACQAMWRQVGIGAAVCLIGLSVGLISYGYNSADSEANTEKLLANAFEEAFSKVRLNVETSGQLSLTPSQVSLKPGATVSIAPSSVIHVEQDKPLKVSGTINNASTDLNNNETGKTRNNEKIPVKDFTVFKYVPYSGGTVVTGWYFKTSMQENPTSQYCYITGEISETGSNMTTIAKDRIPTKEDSIFGSDYSEALSKCIWYKA